VNINGEYQSHLSENRRGINRNLRIFKNTVLIKYCRIRYNVNYGCVSIAIDEILKFMRSEISVSREILARGLSVSFLSPNR
jgi:hypothetical protein